MPQPPPHATIRRRPSMWLQRLIAIGRAENLSGMAIEAYGLILQLGFVNNLGPRTRAACRFVADRPRRNWYDRLDHLVAKLL